MPCSLRVFNANKDLVQFSIFCFTCSVCLRVFWIVTPSITNKSTLWIEGCGGGRVKEEDLVVLARTIIS